MIQRYVVPIAFLMGVAGCEQESQPLPFDVSATTSQTVSTAGGTVSTPAGASVEFPTGSVTGPVTVTLAETNTPTQAQSSGTIASKAFILEPAGTNLSQPAELQLKLSTGASANSWLASLVGIRGGVLDEDATGRVDRSTGLLTTSIERLGTYVAVIPPNGAIFPVQARPNISLSPFPGGEKPFTGVTVDSVTINCGSPSNRCSTVSVTATQNLLDMVANAALLYPEISGALRIGATQVTGSIAASATLRILLESGQTAESVEINALLDPTAATTVTQTATDVRITQVRHRISGNPQGESKAVEQMMTLVIPRSGVNGTVTISRTFDLKVSGGSTQPATVTINFPVRVFE